MNFNMPNNSKWLGQYAEAVFILPVLIFTTFWTASFLPSVLLNAAISPIKQT